MDVYIITYLLAMIIIALIVYLLITNFKKNKYTEILLLDENITNGQVYTSPSIVARGYDSLTLYGFIDNNTIGTTNLDVQISDDNKTWLIIDNLTGIVANGDTIFYAPDTNTDIIYYRVVLNSDVVGYANIRAVLKQTK
jgi:hypothetical protein